MNTVDEKNQILPDWLNGVENFAEVIRENADGILQSLSNEDKSKLYDLLPTSASETEKAIILEDLLKGKTEPKFGKTALESFGDKVRDNHFSENFHKLK